MITRECTACGIVLPITEFYKHKGGKYGVRSVCKGCSDFEHAVWYKANREHVKEHDAQYRKDNSERIAETQKTYLKNNQEHTRITKAKWYQVNRIHARVVSRNHSKTHPEMHRVRQRNRVARVKGAPGNGWSKKEEMQLIDDYCGRCAYCGNKLEEVTMDHVIPITRGGVHSIENIVPACLSCNSSKGNKPLLVWMYQKTKFTDWERLLNVSM